MLKYILDRPVTVTMVMTVIIVLGIVSVRMLPVSLIPDMDVPYITVQVTAPELSAREIDENVAGPLRRQLVQIKSLVDLRSESEEGSLKEKTLEALKEENFHMICVPFRPTAENFSKYFFDWLVDKGYSVRTVEVYETPNNCATYGE